MSRRIRITSIRKDPPDTTLLAQALIALLRYRRDQERLKAEEADKKQKGGSNEAA